MASIEILPKNWKEKTLICSEAETKKLIELGRGVWIDDDCPLNLSVVIIDKDSNGQLTAYRVKDQATESLILSSLKISDNLLNIYSCKKLPKMEALAYGPPSLN